MCKIPCTHFKVKKGYGYFFFWGGDRGSKTWNEGGKDGIREKWMVKKVKDHLLKNVQ